MLYSDTVYLPYTREPITVSVEMRRVIYGFYQFMLKLAGIKFVLKHNPLIFVGQSPISIYASAKRSIRSIL